MEQLTKKAFKQLHAEGALLLIGAPSLALEKAKNIIDGKLAEGVNLGDFGRAVSRADVDGKGCSIWYDEPNSVIYAASAYDSPTYGKTFNTVVYLVVA